MANYPEVVRLLSEALHDAQSESFERDLDAAFGQLIRESDEAAEEAYAAICQNDWTHSSGETAGYTLRASAALIARLRGSGDYSDWYCSGGEGHVSERFAKAMAEFGWSWELGW